MPVGVIARVETCMCGPGTSPRLMAFFTSTSAYIAPSVSRSRIAVKPWPSAICALRAAGADVVGMSMAVETIAARDAGAEVLGLSLVTNRAARAAVPTDIEGIEGVGVEAGPAVAAVVRHVVGSLP